MSKTRSKAEEEFRILEKHVEDPTILPFKKEILALVDAVGKSGQSGGSIGYTTSAVSQAIKTLCLHEPLYGITGEDSEWANTINKNVFQNIRLSSVFKKDKDSRPYYLDAIVFRDHVDKDHCFTGKGKLLKNGSTIGSRQYIKEFPFKPKTFYIDVIQTRWADKDEKVKDLNGDWWTAVIADEKQLEEVWEYYDRF